MKYIIERLKEKSSWAAILTIVAAITGKAIAPELSEVITGIGLGIVGLVAFLTKAK
jgi:hypothetical protein